MIAWHDRVGDLTLFEALTGGAFDRQNGNIAGNLTKFFQKSQMPRGLPGGMGDFGIDRYIKYTNMVISDAQLLQATVNPPNASLSSLTTISNPWSTKQHLSSKTLHISSTSLTNLDTYLVTLSLSR